MSEIKTDENAKEHKYKGIHTKKQRKREREIEREREREREGKVLLLGLQRDISKVCVLFISLISKQSLPFTKWPQ